MKSLHKLFMLSLGALVLCWYGFYNKFPFVYSDTGAYVHSGFLGTVPRDRPLIYGLFIRHMSLAESLWLPIFAQALIISTLVYLLIKYFVKSTHKTFIYWVSIFGISFLTGASMYITFLMPDIFSASLIMGYGLFLFADNLSLRDKIFTIFIILLSIAVHNSNLVTVLSVLLLLALVKLSSKTLTFTWKKLGIAGILLLIGGGSVSITHYIYGNTFKLSQSTNVFFTARLVELGLVQDFLKHNCENNEYNLCEHQGNIGANFLWADNSPLYKTGGWDVNNVEFKKLIRGIMTTPKYLKIFIIRSFEDSFTQFFHFDVEAGSYAWDSPPLNVTYLFFHNQVPQYIASMQMNNRVGFIKTLNDLQLLSVGLGLCGILFFLYWKSSVSNPRLKGLIVFALIALYCNALTCCALSIVIPRYQGRVIWLVPLLLILVLGSIGSELKFHFQKLNQKN